MFVERIKALVRHVLHSRLAYPSALLIGAALLALSELSYHQAEQSLAAVDKRSTARFELNRLRQQVTDAETGQRGYLLTGRPEFLDPYREGVAQVNGTLKALRDYYGSGRPEQAALLRELEKLVQRKLSELDTTVRMRSDGRDQAWQAITESGFGKESMEQLRELDARLVAMESEAIAQERASVLRTLLINRIGIGALTVLGVLGLLLYIAQAGELDAARDAQRQRLQDERDHLEREVDVRTRELRDLAEHLQTAREDERGHLARELHDELGALLTAAKLDVARLKSRLPAQPELRERLDHLSASLNDGIALKRRIIEDLRPSALSNLGLLPALDILCREAGQRMGIPVASQLGEVRLESPADLTVYRFIQEALTNIGKHARAKTVRVSLREADGMVTAEVVDDGVGFDPSLARVGHHGLTGLRYRVASVGGHVTIDSRPGHGTRLRAEFRREPRQA